MMQTQSGLQRSRSEPMRKVRESVGQLPAVGCPTLLLQLLILYLKPSTDRKGKRWAKSSDRPSAVISAGSRGLENKRRLLVAGLEIMQSSTYDTDTLRLWRCSELAEASCHGCCEESGGRSPKGPPLSGPLIFRRLESVSISNLCRPMSGARFDEFTG